MGALFGFVGPPDPDRLEQMSCSLRHRGTDVLTSSSEQFSIGWISRKSLVTSEKGRIGLAPNGKGGLAGFQTNGPTRKQLTVSEIQSELVHRGSLPSDLTGDFVGVFYDSDQFWLFRDGPGARTIYYSEFDGRLFFATEPKSIWKLAGFQRQLNADSLAKYLSFSFVPESDTMLHGLYEVPAGHILHRNADGNQKLQRYFLFEGTSNENQPTIESDEKAVTGFRSVMRNTVADRLHLSDPPTLFLSGGLDSSVVAAEIANQIRHPVRTSTLHFGKDYPNELVFARQVAGRLKTDHQEVLVTPEEFLPSFRKMIWHLDDPIGDPITMPNFILSAKTSEPGQGIFNGEGGDPCFGGPKNLSMLLDHWYGVSRGENYREIQYLKSYRRAYEELDHLFTPEFESKINRDSLTGVLTPYFQTASPPGFLDKLMAINIRLKGAHLILPKVERMLGANRNTPLSPMFSQEMVQFSFQIASNMKLRNGVEKFVIKQAYRNQLPPEIIQRPKSGMRVPVHFWFQGEMKKYAKHILSKKEIRRAGIFNYDRIKKLLNYDIEENQGRYGIRLWMLLTFEVWRRIVLENEAV